MDAAVDRPARRQMTVARLLNLGLAVLALLFAVLFVLQFTVDPSPPWQRRLNLTMTLIWGAFAVDFAVRLILAPDKWVFLRQNWIMAISVCMPALGVLRIFALARVVPALQLGGLAAGGSRGSDALRRSIGAHQSVYIGALTLFVTLLASAGMVSIEATRPDANIQTFGEAVWWCASTMTTIGGELFPVSWEGRTLAVFVMVYGLVIASYITATLAALILGPASSAAQPAASPDTDALLNEIRALRSQLDQSGVALRPTGQSQDAPVGPRPVTPGVSE